MNKKGASFGTLVATIGAVLIALGFAWLIAQNWHQIVAPLKIFILLLVTAASFTAGIMFRTKDYPGIGRSLIVLGSLLYTLSVFLIAQIFSTDATLQGTAFLVLLSWAGVLLFSYIFDSSISLVLALIELLTWLILQYFAFIDLFNIDEFAIGTLVVLLLIVGILLYGLNLLHKSKDHKFSKVYQWWTLFYFLSFAFLLSFQSLLPTMWPLGISFPTSILTYILIILIIAIVTFVMGMIFCLDNNKIDSKELLGFIYIVALLFILILTTTVVSGKMGRCNLKSCYDLQDQTSCESYEFRTCGWENNYCNELRCHRYYEETTCENAPTKLGCEWKTTNARSYCEGSNNIVALEQEQNQVCNQFENDGKSCTAHNECKWYQSNFFNGRSAPPSLWVLWIFSNLVFLGMIIAVIGYGSLNKIPKIINLGITFFVLDVLTRYIGFVADFWGYTSLAVIFIISGLVLILGGWGIEKWRRNLITKANQ
jgi:hypothetical protein